MTEDDATMQHKPIPVAGYKPQSQRTIDLVNENKHMEELCLQTLDRLMEHPGIDKRWLAIGRTHLEQAWMAVNRAVFRPERAKI